MNTDIVEPIVKIKVSKWEQEKHRKHVVTLSDDYKLHKRSYRSETWYNTQRMGITFILFF